MFYIKRVLELTNFRGLIIVLLYLTNKNIMSYHHYPYIRYDIGGEMIGGVSKTCGTTDQYVNLSLFIYVTSSQTNHV